MDPATSAAIVSSGGGLIDTFANSLFSKSASRKAYKRQKEFAQNQISWKVADAKRAGIHPALALGSTQTFSPSAIAGQSNIGSSIAAGHRAARQVKQNNLIQEDRVFQQRSETERLEQTGKVADAQAAMLTAQADALRRNTPSNDGSSNSNSNSVEPPIKLGGKTTLEPDQTVSGAEKIEERYAEWANAVVPYIIGRDIRKNAPKWAKGIWERLKAARNAAKAEQRYRAQKEFERVIKRKRERGY